MVELNKATISESLQLLVKCVCVLGAGGGGGCRQWGWGVEVGGEEGLASSFTYRFGNGDVVNEALLIVWAWP